jgi:hypothetical protein
MHVHRKESLESTTIAALIHSSGFRIGDISVRIDGHHPYDVALVPTLEAFRAADETPDIAINIEWVERFLPGIGKPALFDSGCVWQLYRHDDQLQFDFSATDLSEQPYKRLTIDSSFRRATLQMNRQFFSGSDYIAAPLDYPLDELLIMHRLTQEKAIELHSCGIVRADGVGNLFVGHSGAGKSTTTRLWTAREDVEILSDDRIIVRRDAVAVETPVDTRGAASWHGVFRSGQDDKGRKQIPPSGRNDKNMRMYGTPWHGEAKFASPHSAPLSRIFILEHGHGNILTQLSPSQAVAELFARSFVPFHRHEYVDSALQFLEEVAEAVPVYRYSFEPDERAVDTILNLHD